MRNRQAYVTDPRQGQYKKVLCVCWGNQLRSPTAAFILSLPPFNLNTRSCGLDPNSAVCLIDSTMLEWAEEIVVMEPLHEKMIREQFNPRAPIKCLDLKDVYTFRQPELIAMIVDRYPRS